MFRTSLFLAAAVLSAGTAAPAAAAPAGPDVIGGGKVTDIGDAPWAAQVRFNGGSSHCSGAVIAPRWVLTAAHCAASDDVVLLGSVVKGKGTRIDTDRQVKGDGEDIALLHLTSPYDTTDARYGAAGDRPSVGATVSFYGYGETDASGTPSDNLKTCTMRVKANSGSDGRNAHIITLTKGSGISAKGDSGGPALVHGVIVGTDSNGTSSVKDFADVTAYHDWIAKTIG